MDLCTEDHVQDGERRRSGMKVFVECLIELCLSGPGKDRAAFKYLNNVLVDAGLNLF